jgi:hypothetical protein
VTKRWSWEPAPDEDLPMQSLAEVCADYVRKVDGMTKSKTRAAEILGIHRRSVSRWLDAKVSNPKSRNKR